MLKAYGIRYTLFDNLGIFPPKIAYLLDLLSVNKRYLRDSSVFNRSFVAMLVSPSIGVAEKVYENVNIDISIYSIDNKTKVEIILINKDSSVKTESLLDIAKEIRSNEYTGTRIFQFVKYRTEYSAESIPKSIIENSKQDTIRSLEINNGKVSNIVMNDDKSINVAQVNYNSGSYLIIGTPTIFITY